MRVFSLFCAAASVGALDIKSRKNLVAQPDQGFSENMKKTLNKIETPDPKGAAAPAAGGAEGEQAPKAKEGGASKPGKLEQQANFEKEKNAGGDMPKTTPAPDPESRVPEAKPEPVKKEQKQPAPEPVKKEEPKKEEPKKEEPKPEPEPKKPEPEPKSEPEPEPKKASAPGMNVAVALAVTVIAYIAL